MKKIKESILNVICTAGFPFVFGFFIFVCSLGDKNVPKVRNDG